MKIPFTNPNNLPLIDYNLLAPTQGALKFLDMPNREKLRNSLEKFGFFIPFNVWNDNGHYRLIDGHGRLKFMQEYQVINQNGTTQYPYLIIEADNINEAKEKLLVISSQYHTITPYGFEEFMQDMDKEFIANTVHFDLLEKELKKLSEQQEHIHPESEEFPIVPIDKENASKGVSVPTLKFGKVTINITEEELQLLIEEFEKYTAETKVSFGFVYYLLNKE
jgi:hypothetical protein